MIKTPLFPSSVWDGTTPGRSGLTDDHAPDEHDFDRMAAELIALETNLLGLRATDNTITLAPAVTKGSDPVVTKVNDYLNIITKDIVLALSTAAASFDLGYDIPAGSIVLAAAMNIESAITLATATKIGLGVSGALAKYGTITGGTKNNKSTVAITPTALASAEDLKVYATDNSSAAAGTIANGSIRVRLTLLTQSALPDAA